jgi:hypothetical protein
VLADHVRLGRAVLVVEVCAAKPGQQGAQLVVDPQRLAGGDDLATAQRSWQCDIATRGTLRRGIVEGGDLPEHRGRQEGAPDRLLWPTRYGPVRFHSTSSWRRSRCPIRVRVVTGRSSRSTICASTRRR